MLRLFKIKVFVDNGEERFTSTKTVCAETEEDARRAIENRNYHPDDIVRVLSVREIIPTNGMILD